MVPLMLIILLLKLKYQTKFNGGNKFDKMSHRKVSVNGYESKEWSTEKQLLEYSE